MLKLAKKQQQKTDKTQNASGWWLQFKISYYRLKTAPIIIHIITLCLMQLKT